MVSKNRWKKEREIHQIVLSKGLLRIISSRVTSARPSARAV